MWFIFQISIERKKKPTANQSPTAVWLAHPLVVNDVGQLYRAVPYSSSTTTLHYRYVVRCDIYTNSLCMRRKRWYMTIVGNKIMRTAFFLFKYFLSWVWEILKLISETLKENVDPIPKIFFCSKILHKRGGLGASRKVVKNLWEHQKKLRLMSRDRLSIRSQSTSKLMRLPEKPSMVSLAAWSQLLDFSRWSMDCCGL